MFQENNNEDCNRRPFRPLNITYVGVPGPTGPTHTVKSVNQ